MVWKWVVNVVGDGLMGHVPHRPLPEVSFTHPKHTLLDIMANHVVNVLLWDHPRDDPTHA
jgi:hypothetical protein